MTRTVRLKFGAGRTARLRGRATRRGHGPAGQAAAGAGNAAVAGDAGDAGEAARAAGTPPRPGVPA